MYELVQQLKLLASALKLYRTTILVTACYILPTMTCNECTQPRSELCPAAQYACFDRRRRSVDECIERRENKKNHADATSCNLRQGASTRLTALPLCERHGFVSICLKASCHKRLVHCSESCWQLCKMKTF